MTTARYATALTGGAAGALDAKAVATLADGDIAWVATGSVLYVYKFVAAATDAESSPSRIRPDDYSTAGVWYLQNVSADYSLLSRNHISGGDISRTGANQLTVAPCGCWDSTGEVWLETLVSKTVAIPVAANTIYHIFLVRLVSDGSFTAKAYATEAAAAADTATINAYRWLGFWRTNGASACVIATMSGDYLLFGIASENVVSSGIANSLATVDHTSFIPESRVELIEYGARDASSSEFIYASDDGTNTSFCVANTIASTADTGGASWGAMSNQKSSLKPYLTGRKFRSVTGTLDLLIHQVKLRR
jgi:hypothetical protein